MVWDIGGSSMFAYGSRVPGPKGDGFESAGVTVHLHFRCKVSQIRRDANQELRDDPG